MDARTRIEEAEKRLAEKAEALAAQELEQRAQDIEAREKFEEEHEAVASVTVARYVPGYPTFALARVPSPGEYRRYVDQIGRGVEKKSTKMQRDAQELLASACWVYPAEPDARKKMLDRFPGLLTPLALAAAALAEGRQEEEGKG